ncbi:tetratricopeptide repeat protein [Acetobacter sacchari]|uniref:Tetratricopeptide repeat protein n=1 Tax=Acetobacter sacchari TaxID=2661687 RepID=A0ABS3LUG0_9PROT|nr:tetratricopeptide repeat protein [Acetobacter sacchari]MBO1359540.1 tetratricopeptide repeat protein [Acetobacter sacchari]
MVKENDVTGDIPAEIAAALGRLEIGDAAGAFDDLRAILAREPENVDVLHALAKTAHQAGRYDAAVAYAGKAVGFSSTTDRTAAGLHVTLGLSLLALGHAEPARAALHVATLAAPDEASPRLALAQALEALGRMDDATEALLDAIRMKPAEAGFRLAYGRLLERLGGGDAALSAYEDAVTLAVVGDVVTRQHKAELLRRLGRAEEAEQAFAEVRERLPDDPAALANHGASLFDLGRMEEASEALEASAGASPNSAETQTNLGLVRMACGDLPGADAAFVRASALRPDDPLIALNRGTLLGELGDREAARRLFASVIAARPDGQDAARARFNLGTLDLAEGRFKDGWRNFEARLAFMPPSLGTELPRWEGRPQTGRVLLTAEQGLGDFIQFLRFVPAALERAPVHLQAPPTMIALLERGVSAPNWARSTESGRLTISADAHDGDAPSAHASVLSLPFLLDAGRPPPFLPYLDTRRKDGRNCSVMKIGVCSAGNSSYRFDRRRSISWEGLAGLLAIGDVEWRSLQPGACPPNVVPLPEGDMAQTAAIVGELDLVITVDTAIAHLAGAMGKPVWLLNRYGGDWRWAAGSWAKDESGEQRNLWYPSLRMFQQEEPALPERAWRTPVRAVADTLRAELRLRGARD